MDMKNIRGYMDHLRESQEGTPEELGQRLIGILSSEKAPDIEEVKDLIKAGADLETRDRYDKTPLHVAVTQGHTEAAKALILAGADLDAMNHYSRTPLHFAAIHGKTGVIKALIEAGADLEAKTSDDWTPLHCAAYWGKTEAAKALIEAGADPLTGFGSIEEMKYFFSGDISWAPEEAIQRMRKRSRARGAFGRF